MTRCVALLRGINVGGHAKLAMADLRRVCEVAGHQGVRTYVQSGNMIFDADGDDTAVIGAQLAQRIEVDLGVSASVLVRDTDEFAEVVAANPFREQADADPTKVHVAFLSAEPADPSSLDIADGAYEPEQIAAGDRVRYLHLPGGIGRSKLAAALTDRRTGVDITVRNWRTTTKLLAMAEDRA